MSLEFAAVVRDRHFDVELTVADGETVAVLGPNGAGKSTLLSLIAGLLKPDAGRATLHGSVLFDLDDHGRARGRGRDQGQRQGRRRWVPPHRRGVATLAQDALLFPHLDVLDNVAFGPRSKGLTRAEADARAATWLERVHAASLASRKPAQLSGGQAQRIAVARALATEPALLLLDEPMAALDVSVAPSIRRALREVLVGQTTIIVTHDVLDAFTLADRVIVLEGGRIVDVGPTRDVLDRPATPFAAGLAAVNLLTGTGTDDGVRLGSGQVLHARVVEPIAAGAPAGVAVRPSLVSVSTTEPPRRAGSENVLSGRVTDLEPRGDLVRIRAGELAADVSPRIVADLDLAPDTAVWLAFGASDAVAYPV